MRGSANSLSTVSESGLYKKSVIMAIRGMQKSRSIPFKKSAEEILR